MKSTKIKKQLNKIKKKFASKSFSKLTKKNKI